MAVKYNSLYIYNALQAMSTTHHTHHCSMYLRASIHIPTMLNAVVNESAIGTVLSVWFISNHAMTICAMRYAANALYISFFDICVMSSSLFSLFLFVKLKPVFHAIKPYSAITR